MKKDPFQEQLKNVLLRDERHHAVDSSFLKKKVFEDIQRYEVEQQKEVLMGLLSSQYKKPSHILQESLKTRVLSEIQHDHKIPFVLWILLRRFSAAGLSLALFFTMIIGPLQLMTSPRIVPTAHALKVKCSGSVFVNENICPPLQFQSLLPGDTVRTLDGVAEIVYPDLTLVRTQPFSKVILDKSEQQSLYLSDGDVWVVSPSDKQSVGMEVTTLVSQNRIPNGSAGVSVNGNSSQIVSTTAAVEVQYEKKDTTEVITIAPRKEVTIKKNRVLTRVKQDGIAERDEEWIQDNTEKDQLYLAELKGQAVEQQRHVAGVLPGGVRDYISKMTNSARKALTWDEQNRFDITLRELDELLAESLVLLGEQKMDTSNTTFQSYQDKWSSLLADSSVSVGQEYSESLSKVDQTIKDHLGILSLFNPEDPAYVYKSELEQMVLDHEDTLDQLVSGHRVDEVVKGRILDAHNTARSGNVPLAKEILEKTVGKNTVPFQERLLKIDRTDITLLDDLADESDDLKPLVEEIKKTAVQTMKVNGSHYDNSLIIEKSITGTAYKSSSEDAPENRKTKKIVGQAVKNSDKEL